MLEITLEIGETLVIVASEGDAFLRIQDTLWSCATLRINASTQTEQRMYSQIERHQSLPSGAGGAGIT